MIEEFTLMRSHYESSDQTKRLIIENNIIVGYQYLSKKGLWENTTEVDKFLVLQGFYLQSKGFDFTVKYNKDGNQRVIIQNNQIVSYQYRKNSNAEWQVAGSNDFHRFKGLENYLLTTNQITLTSARHHANNINNFQPQSNFGLPSGQQAKSTPSNAPIAIQPVKQAQDARNNPPRSLFFNHEEDNTPYKIDEIRGRLLRHDERPRVLDSYLAKSYTPQNKAEAATILTEFSIKNVMQNIGTETKVQMVNNNQRGATQDGKRSHDDSALKIIFKSQAEAKQFVKELYERHGIHSHTFGQGYMKTPQGRDGNIVFLTKDDLKKIVKNADISNIADAGNVAYDALKTSLTLSDTNQATNDVRKAPRPTNF